MYFMNTKYIAHKNIINVYLLEEEKKNRHAMSVDQTVNMYCKIYKQDP